VKTIVKGALRDEKGYVLTLVLTLLVLGGLILTPLLGLMSTGLIAGQVYENKMYEYYAADAGIEDALWRLLNEEMDNINWPLRYDLPGLVNNKQVRVAIESVWLLEGLSDLGLPNSQPAEGDSNYGNDHWTVTGAINIDNTANYIIDITSDEPDAENATVDHIGVWLPRGYSYVEGSVEINGVAIGEDDLVKDPDPLEGILHKGGTVLVWDFSGVTFGMLSKNISSSPSGGCPPAAKFPPSVRLSFDYTGSGEVTEVDGGERVYTTAGSDTFTVPAGVTSVTVEVWGGGGGGGGRSSSRSGGAGGGGGGAYAEGTVSVTPGESYTVMVGAGGAGGPTGNNDGDDGEDSWFGSPSTVLACGGEGGEGGTSGDGGRGGRASDSEGSVRYSGGDGADGTNSRSGGGGGGAGDSEDGEDANRTTGGDGGNEGGGDGANGRSSNGAGSSGVDPGGGGSGAYRESSWWGGGGEACAGGDGAPGKIILHYQTEEPQERVIAKGFFSWILLGDSRIAWDNQAGIFHIVSQAASDLDLGVQAGTTVETYTARSFRRYSAGTGGATSAVQGDYIAIGNSLMTSCWETRTSVGPPCDYICPHDSRGLYHTESSATINGDAVPTDAGIEKAYLYWTAYLKDSNKPDEEVRLTVNDGPDISVEAKTAFVKDLQDLGGGGGVEGWQYSCFADVTSQVKAITTDVNGTRFTVGGVSTTPATEASCENQWGCNQPAWNEFANAAWSMIIIYSSQEKETHQIYLYHDALPLWRHNAEFTVTGFEAPEVDEGDMNAQLAVFVAEGDPHYDDDYLKFKGAQTDFHLLGDPDESDPNPYNNVFNGYSTSTGFQPSELEGQTPGRITGVDMDVYTEDKDGVQLSDIVKPGDTSATIRLELEDSSDYIMLVYVVFSVRSIVALGEGFDVGTMTYKIG
jgi:hypothetical protein